MTKLSNPEAIDALLPQTQCGLCGYGGCMPYAEAMVYENAAINLCPPGGVETLVKLGESLQVDPTPYLPEMQHKAKPAVQAVIREAECIGCTKCIQACPVDAIVGSAKLMHTIISDECTGCELCIPPCPVDCIDLSTLKTKYISAQAKQRYQDREVRLAQERVQKQQRKLQESAIKRKAYIQAAIERARLKKQTPKA